jgi:hypothetical protein
LGGGTGGRAAWLCRRGGGGGGGGAGSEGSARGEDANALLEAGKLPNCSTGEVCNVVQPFV